MHVFASHTRTDERTIQTTEKEGAFNNNPKMENIVHTNTQNSALTHDRENTFEIQLIGI